MANPATLLHRTLSTWRVNGNHFADPMEHRIAVRHLDSIAELLNQMDDAGLRTDLYRGQYDRWVELTLHHPHGWQKQKQLGHLDDAALTSLDYLADRLDSLTPRLQDGGSEAVLAYVESVQKLLDEDQSIKDVSLRRHLKQLIAHVEWCVRDFEAVGEFDLQDAIERLVAAMVRATAASSQREKWKEKLNTVVWPFVVGVATELAAGNAQLAIAAAFGIG